MHLTTRGSEVQIALDPRGGSEVQRQLTMPIRDGQWVIASAAFKVQLDQLYPSPSSWLSAASDCYVYGPARPRLIWKVRIPLLLVLVQKQSHLKNATITAPAEVPREMLR